MIDRFIWALDRAIKSLKQFYDQLRGPHTQLLFIYNYELPFVSHEDTRAAKKRKTRHGVSVFTPLPAIVCKTLGSEGGHHNTVRIRVVGRMILGETSSLFQGRRRMRVTKADS